MKKFIIYVNVFLCLSVVAQKNKKFKTGVEILQIEKKENYQVPKSILIEFTGHTHSIYFYKDLAKKLQKRFKKKSIKVGFNYSLSAKNPWKYDLDLIPKIKHKESEYDLIGKISFPKYDMLGEKFEFSKLNLKLSVRVLKKSELQIKSILNVNTYKTILTQNRKVSKTIVKILTENN